MKVEASLQRNLRAAGAQIQQWHKVYFIPTFDHFIFCFYLSLKHVKVFRQEKSTNHKQVFYDIEQVGWSPLKEDYWWRAVQVRTGVFNGREGAIMGVADEGVCVSVCGYYSSMVTAINKDIKPSG